MVGASELAIFAAVVTEKSFSAAAEKTGLSNTVVSKKITALEKELNTQLLYRTTRKLSLTHAGELLFEYAQGINQQAKDAFDAINELSEDISGHIKMSVPTISGELLLADVVAKFCQKYPKVSIELRLENELVDLIEQGIDLAIRTANLEDSSMIARHLMQSSWVLCSSPTYLANAPVLKDLSDLPEHNCLCYELQSDGSNEWRFTQNEQLQTVRVSGSFSSNNAPTLKRAALNHAGIIYVPKCCVYEELASGKLITVLPDYEPRSLGVYAIYPYTRHKPKKIQLLIEDIKQAYEQLEHYFT